MPAVQDEFDYDKTVTLPDSDEMMRRLKEVRDMGHLVKHLYPEFLKNAGNEYSAPGIVNMFLFGIDAFMQQGYPPVVNSLVSLSVPRWIDALVDDPEVAAAAKQFYNEVINTQE